MQVVAVRHAEFAVQLLANRANGAVRDDGPPGTRGSPCLMWPEYVAMATAS